MNQKITNYELELQSLSELQEKKIKVKIELLSGFRHSIKINIDKSLITSNLITEDQEIIFLLLIKYNHPISPPSLYCLTKFSSPELSDARDFLEDVILQKWSKKKKKSLKKLISSIPDFINRYLQFASNKENAIKIIGKYYLDVTYNLNVLKLFPNLYLGEIKEIVAFANDKRVYDEKRVIMITESFLLLFIEKSIFENQKLKLIFWAPIYSLSFLKQLNDKNIIEMKWKAKKSKTTLMRIKSDSATKIFDILMDCLNKQKIEFTITNESKRAKKGELPKIEIVDVEEEISKLEIKIKVHGKDSQSIKQLMNLYEKAVQYYSAINDYRYQIYMRKTKKLFAEINDSKKSLDKKKKVKKGKGKSKKEKNKKDSTEEKKIENEEKEKIKADEVIKEILKENNTENEKKEENENKIEEEKENSQLEKKDKKEEKEIKKKEEEKTNKTVNKSNTKEKIHKKKGMEKFENSDFNMDLDDD